MAEDHKALRKALLDIITGETKDYSNNLSSLNI